MTTYQDLKDFFAEQDFDVTILADAAPRSATRKKGQLNFTTSAGGVAVALEPVAKASGAFYIGRGKAEEKDIYPNKKSARSYIDDPSGSYELEKLFLSDEELDNYYYGFANQTLWPLCHVAFEQPIFKKDWFEGFKQVNLRFAEAAKKTFKKKTFVWINDYHLCMVPSFLQGTKNTTLAMFWHIPWPTWEVFRILPEKKEILESLLMCDYLAFHRGYHVRNFYEAVKRELEARIDEETHKIYYKGKVTVVNNLPMGVDVDVIKSLAIKEEDKDLPKNALLDLFDRYKIILGVDRLDYTKGLLLRLQAIDTFFEKNPKYVCKVAYIGIVAPSREPIPSYQLLKKDLRELAANINDKYATKNWKPINIFNNFVPRDQVIKLFQKAQVCLVTPRDDGMNLVSKEFVLASSNSKNPGMLVLSKFAGSAIDLTESLIVNPYDLEEVANALKNALEMDQKHKTARTMDMAQVLEARNVYEWAQDFIEEATSSVREKSFLQIYR